jgi:hypothetical protein
MCPARWLAGCPSHVGIHFIVVLRGILCGSLAEKQRGCVVEDAMGRAIARGVRAGAP